MTLAELAALAAKVEGFERPTHDHGACDGTGAFWTGLRSIPCRCQFSEWKEGSGKEWDNSPAALWMAVAVYCSERALTLEIDEYHVLVSAYARSATANLDSASPGTIARAALVAMLRAHGVEVGDE